MPFISRIEEMAKEERQGWMWPVVRASSHRQPVRQPALAHLKSHNRLATGSGRGGCGRWCRRPLTGSRCWSALAHLKSHNRLATGSGRGGCGRWCRRPLTGSRSGSRRWPISRATTGWPPAAAGVDVAGGAGVLSPAAGQAAGAGPSENLGIGKKLLANASGVRLSRSEVKRAKHWRSEISSAVVKIRAANASPLHKIRCRGFRMSARIFAIGERITSAHASCCRR
jgi:hypothetical protein